MRLPPGTACFESRASAGFAASGLLRLLPTISFGLCLLANCADSSGA